MKTSIKLLLPVIFFLSFQNLILSQDDSLKGFELFKFGDTKDECVKMLNAFTISYDTLGIKTSAYNDTNHFIKFMKEMINVTAPSTVNYYDTMKLSGRNFTRRISLFFDRINDYKLFSIEIKIDEPCETLDSSMLYASELMRTITDKYGSNYDTSSISLWYPPAKTCTRNFKDGYLKTTYDTHTFYEYDELDMLKINTVKNGKFHFTLQYTDLVYSVIFLNNMEKEIETLQENFNKNFKK